MPVDLRPLPVAAGSPLLDGIVAEHLRLTRVHSAFVAQQAEAHRRFLSLRHAPAAAVAETPRLSRALTRALTSPPANAARRELRGFTRQDLEVHASGRISSIFGGLFAQQDGFARQVRMPEPPLLLADRVTDIEGEPGGGARHGVD
jgi:hypothetical protein